MAEDKQLYQNGNPINPIVSVIDALDSTETTKPLSANKGKVLNEGKLDKLPKASGDKDYEFPYHFETPIQNQDNVSAVFHTIELNDTTKKYDRTISIPSADISANKAGLYNQALANAKQDKSTLETDVAAKGFTKNLGTITGIKMNGSSKGTSGEVDLGTVITEHQDISGKADKTYVDTEVAKKVTREISSGTGKAIIFNEASGGGAKYEFTGGQKSFIGVNNDLSDIMAQIYALDNTNKGTRINVKQSAIYYTKNKDSPTVTDGDEIAVKSDVNAKSKVEWSQLQTSGNKIAEIKIDGTATEIYAPTSGGGGTISTIKMNGSAVTVTGGVADLGTVITAHQDITGKINKLGDVPGAVAGTKYRFPYNFLAPVQSANDISAKFQTLIIDDNTSGGDYTITIPSADISGNKAGLYNKTIDDTIVHNSEMKAMTNDEVDALTSGW